MSHRDRFIGKLRQQFEFLETSCVAFDRGSHAEAIRIGGVARTLFKDKGRNSTSLLTHLDAWDVRLVSTAPRDIDDPSRFVFYFSLVQMRPTGLEPMNIPPTAEMLMPAAEWWKQVVIIPKRGTYFTREGLCVTVAEKEGAAHVDAATTPEFDHLSNEFIFAFRSTPGGVARRGVPEFPLFALRTLGHEILHSAELRDIAGLRPPPRPPAPWIDLIRSVSATVD